MKRVLFVCIGNTCRSPMAEGFANHYGRDVLVARSCGLMPVPAIDPRTVVVMEERGVDISRHEPSYYDPRDSHEFDIIVNISGYPLANANGTQVIDWSVKDPYNAELEAYRVARDDIERRVMLLILELRRNRDKSGK